MTATTETTTVAVPERPTAHAVIVEAAAKAAEHYKAAGSLKAPASQAKRRAEGDREIAVAVGTLASYPTEMLTQEAQRFLTEHSPKLVSLVAVAETVEATLSAQRKAAEDRVNQLQAAMCTTAYTLIDRLAVKTSEELQAEWSKSQPEISRMVTAGRYALDLGTTSAKQIVRLKSIATKPERYGKADAVRGVIESLTGQGEGTPSFAAFEKALRERKAADDSKPKDGTGEPVGTDTPATVKAPDESKDETDLRVWAVETAAQLSAVMVKLNRAGTELPDHGKVTGLETVRNLAATLAAYVTKHGGSMPANVTPEPAKRTPAKRTPAKA
jgi:hypothetical protein